VNIPFNDKERLGDALASHKQMTSDYNSFANESATPEVVSKVMEILRDEHDIQRDMWCEMNSRGYVEVHDNSSADIGIITSYIKRTNTYVGYDYPYWWYDFYYYWPFDYWDPYYNGWYPYYPYPVTYSYTTGTLVVEMIALKEAKKESQQLPFIWTACMAGVESSNQVNISKAISGIYQAFEQSPYINHKAQ